MADNHVFESARIKQILDSVTNKTLGEVDKNHVFDRTITNPKITGIAGDVIEQSVLGYPSDRDQRPDLEIDGVLVELKTTGIREGRRSGEIEAKEPVSITAVSIDRIAGETFENSAFWHKVEHMLFVFYHYDSQETVRASGYANFLIRGYKSYDFDGDTRAILERDWQKIHDFIQGVQEKYNCEEARQHYPDLSSVINDQLVYLDTAPKYPNPPRFRFRRRFVTMLVQEKFGKKLESLPDTYHDYSEVYVKCHDLTKKYMNKTFEQLCNESEINIDIKGKTNRQLKSYAERIVVKMFGGQATKISKINLFASFGLVGKTVVLTSKGKRTEDMKLIPVNFDEIEQQPFYEYVEGEITETEIEDLNVVESSLHSYLHDHKLLCVVFEEQPNKSKEQADLRKNIFKGFKVLNLDSPDIVESAETTWNSVQTLLKTKSLKSTPVCTKEGKPRVNKNGQIMEKTNLPKSRDHLIFLRGTGNDSGDKISYKGVKIYKQNFWIKGSYIAEQLEKTKYL